jgi:mannitol-1-/sugar-/sorbitol-6-/2-deoxyglucose-6-phosphatase
MAPDKIGACKHIFAKYSLFCTMQILTSFPIKAIIFDMDGLLIDSEPYWKMAEKKVFGELGLDLDDDLLRQVMGFRLSEVVKHWYNYKPWPDPDFEQTEQYVLATVKELIINEAEVLPGVHALLEYLHRKQYKMAVAS